MQQVRRLSAMLRELFSAIEDEASHNSDFAAKIGAILVTTTPKKASPRKAKPVARKSGVEFPDVFSALDSKGEEEFRYWLRSLDVRTLRGIVRANGYDPQKRTQKWTDQDKLIDLIVEQTTARRNRGSAFLTQRDK